jgi:bifunctional non-homologous end joining protein LigD
LRNKSPGAIRRHQVDLRLERDGVYKSWAVPKGLPEQPGVTRLAIEVEDHPHAWGEFKGSIPAGEFGAGQIRIWDAGTYDTLRWTPEHIEVHLHGARLQGVFEILRFRRGREREWLILQKGG